MAAEYLFGYGSLAARSGSACELRGYRRRWSVAMDNTRTIPGYKYYVDARSGTRPSVFVAFLDLQRATVDHAVNGLAFEVSARELAALDRRERNYRRVEVTRDLDPAPEGARIWAYVGTADAHERAERGLAEGRLVVSGEYARSVAAGFAALGPAADARYRASTDDPPCPVADLRRVDLAPG